MDVHYRTGDPGDEHVEIRDTQETLRRYENHTGQFEKHEDFMVEVQKPEAPAVVWMCLRHDDEHIDYGMWSEHASDKNEFPHRYINGDALLAWLLSRTGNEQIRLQCLAAHVLVERFLEEHER